jgi:uncharacterized protein (DUF2141 family)
MVARGQNKLHITIAGIKSKGTIYIAIYDKAACFANPHKAYRKLVSPANAPSLTTTAENLPTGTYAIAVYQDLNDNKKIDKNILGIPTEPFAFSNNVRPVVSAPTFQQCRILVDKPEQSITIGLHTYL